MKNSRIKSRTWKIHGLKLLFDRSLRFRNPTVLNAASTNVILTNAEVKYPRVLTLEAAVVDLRIRYAELQKSGIHVKDPGASNSRVTRPRYSEQ